MSGAESHWQRVYEGRSPEEVSWYEPLPENSLDLIDATRLRSDEAILDAGGGASGLAGALLEAGYTDVTVADVSAAALQQARSELGDRAEKIKWVEADVLDHDFDRQFDLWHDRAVFHFMVEPDECDDYLATLRRTLRPGGHLIISTFGPEGPTQCSGLPVQRYGAEGLADLLRPEFEQVSSKLRVHRTPSGGEQQFLHASFLRREA